MADSSTIEILGAREHNLKNLNLRIPRNRFVVITGLSGSGKSSLAFDTIYAEGQRRYLESLSSYARQFLEKMKKPDVDYISGLSPSIAIEQRSVTHNPRSTVATVTEIYDYLRLLFAKLGDPFCHLCRTPLVSRTPAQILEELRQGYAGKNVLIMAPVARGRKGEFEKVFQGALKKGFSRARIDGKIEEITPGLKLRKNYRHDIEIVIDHAAVKPGDDKRLLRSVEQALEFGGGAVSLIRHPAPPKSVARFLSVKRTCPECQISLPDLIPNMFSFNSPYGACPRCKGLGTLTRLVSGGLIRDPSKPLMGGALSDSLFFSFNKYLAEDLLYDLTKKFNFEWDTPWDEWPQAAQEAFLWGDEDLDGLIEELERLFHQTKSEDIRRKIRRLLREDACPDCSGQRLRKESLSVRVGGLTIAEAARLSVEKAAAFFSGLRFPDSQKAVAGPILREISGRLRFILDVGLGYLTLDRSVATLAGGELQRIRLAAQLGVGLTGVLYVLDEPSIGLHPGDNRKLIDTLLRLRDMKNTVLVVEHDEETMRRADHLIDLGPGAGRHGGELVAEGPARALDVFPKSVTAQYLDGRMKIALPRTRKSYDRCAWLEFKGCEEHNLKKIDVKIPLGLLVCVTGVSGSGKSTLVHDTVYKALHNRIWKTDYRVGKYRSLKGAGAVDKIIEIDQSPIGRTPRSNPATYTDLFGFIRKLLSQTQEAKMRGFSPSRFSFNLKGGRCETCRGEGFEKLQMSFMPDVYVGCEDCRGNRYNEQTLEVRYRGKNIAEVLDLSVEEALRFFSEIPAVRERLALMKTIGLGYLRLGQPSNTLSGGEAQRIKIASELSKKATGKTMYLLDEPTTGLHFADIENLLKALFQLRDQGNTILVIEHNLDVIKMADFIIDLGPEGGEKGGRIVARGSPEEVVRSGRSATAVYLKECIGRAGAGGKRV